MSTLYMKPLMQGIRGKRAAEGLPVRRIPGAPDPAVLAEQHRANRASRGRRRPIFSRSANPAAPVETSLGGG